MKPSRVPGRGHRVPDMPEASGGQYVQLGVTSSAGGSLGVGSRRRAGRYFKYAFSV
jgi:hypothetical protein